MKANIEITNRKVIESSTTESVDLIECTVYDRKDIGSENVFKVVPVFTTKGNELLGYRCTVITITDYQQGSIHTDYFTIQSVLNNNKITVGGYSLQYLVHSKPTTYHVNEEYFQKLYRKVLEMVEKS